MASLCHAAFPYCCAELSAMLGSGELLGAPFGQQELRLVLFSKASSPDPKEAKATSRADTLHSTQAQERFCEGIINTLWKFEDVAKNTEQQMGRQCLV